MNTKEKAFADMRKLKDDACSGRLSEKQCIERLDQYKAQYGEDYFMVNRLGEIVNMPPSQEKLDKLKIVYAQGGSSKETFIEMARTGYALRNKRITKVIITVGSAVLAIAVVIGIVVLIVKNR